MSDVVDNPENYFRALVPPRDEFMVELETQAEKEAIPIVGPLMGELLYILTAATGAKRILELGTANGYSAIYLARGCQAVDGIVVTLEADSHMAARARENFRRAGVSDRIEIHETDALEMLPQLQGSFDLIFLDIEKLDYATVLPDCQRLIKKGGLLVADNVAFQDADEFNQTMAGNSAWRSVSLLSYLPLHSPERDAICISIRC